MPGKRHVAPLGYGQGSLFWITSHGVVLLSGGLCTLAGDGLCSNDMVHQLFLLSGWSNFALTAWCTLGLSSFCAPPL